MEEKRLLVAFFERGGFSAEKCEHLTGEMERASDENEAAVLPGALKRLHGRGKDAAWNVGSNRSDQCLKFVRRERPLTAKYGHTDCGCDAGELAKNRGHLLVAKYAKD